MNIIKFITNFIGVVPKNERRGIAMKSDEPTWKLMNVKRNKMNTFFQELSSIVSDGSILYLEGCAHSPKILRFFEKVSILGQIRVEMGTIWPKPKIYHVPATYENLCEIASLSKGIAPQELADHIHVYKNGKVILQWYDAFMDCLYISKDIPEEKISEFCNKLSSQYE